MQIISRTMAWLVYTGCKKSTLIYLVGLTLAASFYRGHGVSDNYYAISQWLVTYESGFIKRALLGTLIQLEFLSHISGWSVPVIYAWVSNLVLALLYLVVGLVLLRMVHLSSMALIFLPYFLVGPLLRTQSVYIGYTDQVVALLAISVVALMIRGRDIAASLLLGISILVHETTFVLVAPVVFYRICICWISDPGWAPRYRQLKRGAILLLAPLLVFAGIILWQEIYLPRERILVYLQEMLSRQDPPYYRIDMISEIYTFSFSDWYGIHAAAALDRMVAWKGVNGYMGAIWLPALIMHGFYFLSVPAIRQSLYALPLVWASLLSPLLLHWWVVDHDRVTNLVTWVSFLSLWVLIERIQSPPHPSAGIEGPGKLLLMLLLTFVGFLFPQARSDLDLGARLLIYLPLALWCLVILVGCCVRKPAQGVNRARVL